MAVDPYFKNYGNTKKYKAHKRTNVRLAPPTDNPDDIEQKYNEFLKKENGVFAELARELYFTPEKLRSRLINMGIYKVTKKKRN